MGWDGLYQLTKLAVLVGVSSSRLLQCRRDYADFPVPTVVDEFGRKWYRPELVILWVERYREKKKQQNQWRNAG